MRTCVFRDKTCQGEKVLHKTQTATPEHPCDEWGRKQYVTLAKVALFWRNLGGTTECCANAFVPLGMRAFFISLVLFISILWAVCNAFLG